MSFYVAVLSGWSRLRSWAICFVLWLRWVLTISCTVSICVWIDSHLPTKPLNLASERAFCWRLLRSPQVSSLCRHCLMCLWKVHRQLYVCWTLSLSIHWKHICALSKTVANLCHVVDINYTANVVQLVGYLSFFFLLYFLSIFIGYFMILQSLD